MARKKKDKNNQTENKESQKREKKVKNKRIRKVREKKELRRKKQKKEKEEKKQKSKKQAKIDLNVYNQLFDEVNLFSKEINLLKTKEIKQRLILLDGKIIWLEKQSEKSLASEEGTNEIIELEMEMLEMDMSDKVELSSVDFKQYVKDEWDWSNNFYSNSEMYIYK